MPLRIEEVPVSRSTRTVGATVERDRAKLTANVVFPTPPLPEETVMIRLMRGLRRSFSRARNLPSARTAREGRADDDYSSFPAMLAQGAAALVGRVVQEPEPGVGMEEPETGADQGFQLLRERVLARFADQLGEAAVRLRGELERLAGVGAHGLQASSHLAGSDPLPGQIVGAYPQRGALDQEGVAVGDRASAAGVCALGGADFPALESQVGDLAQAPVAHLDGREDLLDGLSEHRGLRSVGLTRRFAVLDLEGVVDFVGIERAQIESSEN